MRNSSANNPQKLRCTMTPYAPFMRDYLAEKFGSLKCGAKLLARAAHVSPRTAENWLSGICAPQGQALLHLISECDDLADRLIKNAKSREENP